MSSALRINVQKPSSAKKDTRSLSSSDCQTSLIDTGTPLEYPMPCIVTDIQILPLFRNAYEMCRISVQRLNSCVGVSRPASTAEALQANSHHMTGQLATTSLPYALSQLLSGTLMSLDPRSVSSSRSIAQIRPQCLIEFSRMLHFHNGNELCSMPCSFR